jgi:predicted RNA-binding Zn-ribbon protein involved in translation (DUF1610 family)
MPSVLHDAKLHHTSNTDRETMYFYCPNCGHHKDDFNAIREKGSSENV